MEIDIPDGAPLICLVGGNGTGKSQILELIAASAQLVGISQGVEMHRDNPQFEDAEYEVRFHLKPRILPGLDNPENLTHHIARELYASWDRTLTVQKNGVADAVVLAGGIASSDGVFAQQIVDVIRHSQSVHYLSLDADRAYPKVNIQGHQLGDIYDRDWETSNKSSSHLITRNLYEEWFRYLIGRESQENNRHVQAIRKARDQGLPDPVYVDQFEGYKTSLRRVLPHLLFVGANSQTRQIQFDSTGIPLTFNQLSGGEREIAFLVGQIERFGLKKGLLLVDEPELHLNSDLLRAWIGFLKDSVEEGQIWLATHSLEVVEVAGQDATIVLERDQPTRVVTKATRLSHSPVLATLSRSVGSPAFSISNLAFVFVEGEEEIGERERFRLLSHMPPQVRFIEAGSCKEVLRRIDSIRDISGAADQNVRVGGVVDRDWRDPAELKALAEAGVFVLGVHEIENFFLHPPTLRDVLQINGSTPEIIDELILEGSDRRAGAWIFDAARTSKTFADYPPPSKEVRSLVHGLTWAEFADLGGACELIAKAHGNLSEEQISKLSTHLKTRAKIYERKRSDRDSLWKVCEGKEVFRSLVAPLGFADQDAAERAIVAAWARKPEVIPNELAELRNYLQNL